MSDYRMSGSGLYNENHELLAKARGESLFDHANQRIGFVRGDTLFDPEERTMMSVQGSEIYDASGKKIAPVSVVKKSIKGAEEEMIATALWFCYVR
jgi:hypothetical protein